jgi:hypothetical protein
MENMTVSVQLINAILTYLGQRPYVEVAGLITQIQQAATPPEIESKDD